MEKTTVVMDKQGRIYLPKKLKTIGRRFFIVKIDKEFMLVPIPSDPVKELEKIGKGLPKKSLRQFKKEILEEARKAI